MAKVGIGTPIIGDAGDEGNARWVTEETASPVGIEQPRNVATEGGDNSSSAEPLRGFIDPESAGNSSSNSSDTSSGSGKRRGRKPGSRNKSSGGGAKETSRNLDSVLFNIHFMLANLTGVPEMIISKEESSMYSAALKDAEVFDSIPLTDKQIAMGNLALVLATIYGPRVIAVVNRRKRKAPINVTPINQPRSSATSQPPKEGPFTQAQTGTEGPMPNVVPPPVFDSYVPQPASVSEVI